MTSITLIIPDWFAWTIIGMFFISTCLSIIGTRLRWQLLQRYKEQK